MGVPAIVVAGDQAMAYARAWDWPLVVTIEGADVAVRDVARDRVERVARERALELLG